MNPYMFVINVVPAINNPNYVLISRAIAHVWVFSNRLDSAKEKALEYIEGLSWTPEDVEYEFLILPEQLAKLEKFELSLYQRARLYGIAADFLGCPTDH